MQHPSLSRRGFLLALTAAAAGLAEVNRGGRALAAATTSPAINPQSIVRDGGLVRIPGRGELYIASDFHTRHADFQRWLSATDLVRKLKDRDDVYGLILGDAVDAKPGDTQAEKEGDSRIINTIREIQEGLGGAGKRLIFILGNHEHAVVQIYGLLKTHFALTPMNRRQLVNRLYKSIDGAFYQQFNFLERISEEQFAYLQKLPLAVMTANGIVGIHAGPSKTAKSSKDIEQANPQVVEEMLWSRPAEIQEGGYTTEDLNRFLVAMDNSRLVIAGHTPLSGLPREWLQNGLGVYGDRQVILATSYGAEPDQKSHLKLDLAKTYAGAASLAVGKEIQRLAPCTQRGHAPQSLIGHSDSSLLHLPVR